MKNLILSVVVSVLLSSCIATTVAKVAVGTVKTAGKVAVGTVKTAAKGIGWTINKANGKINETRLDGKWKVTGLYKGNFSEFASQSNPVNQFSCDYGDDIYEFKIKKEKFYRSECGNTESQKYKIKYSFDKNPETKEHENMFTYGPSYFTVIDVTGSNLALEGYFIEENGTKVKSICLLEKTK